MQRFRRALGTLSIVGLLTLAMALPAGATPKDANGEHKVTICHVTNSATNPWVILEVDVAAFDGEGKNDHTHHESKDGRVDVLAVDGTCPAVGGTTTTTTTTIISS